MIYLKYGSGNFDMLALKEIREGRPVVIQIFGWRKKFIYKLLGIFSEHCKLLNEGRTSLGLSICLWCGAMFAPTIIGLCNYARAYGMAIKISEENTVLEVKFEKVS